MCFEQHHQRRGPREAPGVRCARQVRTIVEWRTRRMPSSTFAVPARGQVFPGFLCPSGRARYASGEWTPSAPFLKGNLAKSHRRPICEKSAARVIANSAELKKLRDEAMVEQKFHKSKRAAAMKEPAATFSQDDAHKQPMTGQVLSTSPSIATPTADDELSRPSVHHVAAAAAPVGRSFRMSTNFLHGVSVRNEWLRLTTLGMQVKWQSLIMNSVRTILTQTTAATPEKRRCQHHPRHNHAQCHAPTISVHPNITCSLFGKATHDRAWPNGPCVGICFCRN